MSHVHSPDGDMSCFGCRIRTIRFDGPGERAMEIRKRDKEFSKDSEAYRRLRKEGLQPRGVNKSAMAEALATHRQEIEIGRDATKEEVRAFNRQQGAI